MDKKTLKDILALKETPTELPLGYNDIFLMICHYVAHEKTVFDNDEARAWYHVLGEYSQVNGNMVLEFLQGTALPKKENLTRTNIRKCFNHLNEKDYISCFALEMDPSEAIAYDFDGMKYPYIVSLRKEIIKEIIDLTDIIKSPHASLQLFKDFAKTNQYYNNG